MVVVFISVFCAVSQTKCVRTHTQERDGKVVIHAA